MCREMCVCVWEHECLEGWGVLRGLERLLGCLFYQKDCSKAFNKHSTEGKLSNQIHREIKGYVWLNQARRRSLDVSLLGNGNWFLTKVLHGSCHGWWIKFETTENLDRVYLRQIVIHPPVSTQTHTTHTNSYIQAEAFHRICNQLQMQSPKTLYLSCTVTVIKTLADQYL